MKKSTRILLSATISLLCSKSFAQAPFSATEYLDINKFSAAHMVHGDMWYDPGTGEPGCEYPKSTGKHANIMGSLWVSGRDALGNLYTSAQMYRASGVDYWPGPLDITGTLTLASSSNWAKIWKVDATTIADFRSAYSSGGSSAITASKYDIIKEWPAVGNIYAIGATGSSLPELLAPVGTAGFAPFVDINFDGVYNWKDGDYPKIKGDQMLWWVFSDNGPTHDNTKGTPLKVEFHAMAYAYNRGSSVDRMLFYEYTMINKSTERYTDFRFGLFSDADLGSPFDDYIGFDSTYRMGVEYNAAIPDRPNGANSYGMHPPITGLSFVEMPGDIYPSAMLPAGTFNYFNNTSIGTYSEPVGSIGYDNIMRAKGNDGTPRSFGNYAYPFSKGAVECDSSYIPSDRRYIITSSDYAFQPNTVAKIGMVFMVTDTSGNACGSFNLKELTDLADTAWDVYWYPLPSLGVKQKTSIEQNFKLYPNPAETILYLSTNTSVGKTGNIRIVDALGRTINLPIVQKNNQYEININSLASGIYSVIFDDGNTVSTQRFVKK